MTESNASFWARADQVLAAAMDREGPAREAYLDAACAGDAELRAEVMALLSSMSRAESIIGDSADALLVPSGPLEPAPDAMLEPGSIVGPYRVRRLLGRGGMGNVYAAVRADDSITREVALKVVRSGLSAGVLSRRLHQEQRILASLEHPRIARLYDAGLADDGTPYLAMELVDGVRIDRYVRDRNAGFRDTLALGEQVCEAVAFAHQRLVVHRDLKPANVLVDAGGQVHLLDFGIARLVSHDEEGADPLTRPGQLVLTPEYAAPEQARGAPASASMDVYALGVLLHELLIGERPRWQRLVVTRAPDAEIVSAMVPPSRQATDPGLARALHGDLDAVLLKALAPDPEERYGTVQELRDELARVREGQPVRVRRWGALERAVRSVRRHPLPATAWALAAILAIAFVANTLVQRERIARERDRANAARDVAAAQRDRARTTSRLLATLFERADPLAPGRGDTLRVTQVLAEGLERVNRELAGQPAARAELLTAIGRALAGMGRHDEAQAALDTARALQAADPDVTDEERAATLTALGNLARARGREADAVPLHEQALTLRREAGDASDTTARLLAIALVNVGAGHMERARFDSARVYLDSGIVLLRRGLPRDSAGLGEALNNRATLAMRVNDFPLAARLAREALAINRSVLGPGHPRVAGEMANLGFLLDRTGRSAEAEPILREATRLLAERLPDTHVMLRTARLNLGGVLSRTGRLEEAERVVAAVLATERAMPDARAGLSMTLDNHAGVLEKLGRMRDAQQGYREALAVQLDVGGEAHPGVAILRGKVADIGCRIDGPSDEVFDLFARSTQGLSQLFPEAHPFRVGARGTRGRCLLRAGRREEGEGDVRAAFDVARAGPPQLHGMARQFGEALLALYAEAGERDAESRVRAQLDSLPVVAPVRD